MLLFVKHYKQEVLGVGEVALPGEGGALREATIQRTAKEAKDRSNTNKKDAVEHQGHGSAGSTNGTDEKKEYVSKQKVLMSVTFTAGNIGCSLFGKVPDRRNYLFYPVSPPCRLALHWLPR